MYRKCAFYAKNTGKYLGFCADGEAFCVNDTNADVTVRKYISNEEYAPRDKQKFIGETDAHITIQHMTINSGGK